jgi:hypothetical protein
MSLCYCVITDEIVYDIFVGYVAKFLRKIPMEKWVKNKIWRVFPVSKSIGNFINKDLTDKPKIIDEGLLTKLFCL